MKITQGNKQMEITIDSYEFPYDKHGMKEDNNWLNIKAVWEDDVIKQEGIVPCLLTYEVTQMIDDMEAFLDQQQDFYISDFLEDNLHIKVKPYEDGFAVYLSFLFKHQNEPYIIVKHMNINEFKKLIEEVKQQQSKFPER